jgi:RNA polymerase sigma-70 factor (ECF subfamily)
MSASKETGPAGGPAGATLTLGDVLYADRTTGLVAEADWVALVQRMAAGNLAALHALYDRTHRIVFTLMIRIVDNRESAEELTLDVFHDVWRRASHYDKANGTVLGWIMNQARSRAIDRLRLEQRKKRVNPYPEEADTATAARGPQESLEQEQQSRLLKSALSGLSELERQAIETAFFSELTYAQTAARLNEPLGTVKTRIRSGLQKLRTALASGRLP